MNGPAGTVYAAGDGGVCGGIAYIYCGVGDGGVTVCPGRAYGVPYTCGIRGGVTGTICPRAGYKLLWAGGD